MNKPGLFVTGTDTGVGKTVITCAIAAAMRAARPGAKVGVCKPIATGCRREPDGNLVSEDAEMQAKFSGCALPLDVINPVRYEEPVAPAVAAERAGRPVNWDAIAASLAEIDAKHEAVLVEGVGGILVPLDRNRTVLDLMGEIGFPVVVVARPNLGTLNHTAMTCRLIRAAGLRLAGIVINRCDAASAGLAEKTNPSWLAAQNETEIVATAPDAAIAAGASGNLPEKIFAAISATDWWSMCDRPL